MIAWGVVACIGPEATDALELAESSAPMDTSSTPDTANEDTATTVAPLNLGAGFVDVTDAVYAAASYQVVETPTDWIAEPTATSGVFADLDSDGAIEVVLTDIEGEGTSMQVFDIAADGTMTRDDALTEVLAGLVGSLTAIVDLDGDGWPDLVPGKSAPIHFGTGAGSFQAVMPTPPSQRGLSVVAFGDVDMDGWTDIIQRPVGGCTEGSVALEVYYRTATRTWETRPDTFAAHPGGQAYAAGVLPLGAEQTVIVSAGRTCSMVEHAPGFFVSDLDEQGYPVLNGFDPTPEDSAYKLESAVNGGPLTLTNPMGYATADLDGDGRVDLLLTTTQKQIQVFQDLGQWPLVDRTTDADLSCPDRDYGPEDDPKRIRRMTPWGIATPDIDLDGRPDILYVNGHDGGDFLSNEPGDQHTVVERNIGAFGFEDITEMSGLKQWGQWRSLTYGDFDGDARPDVIVGGLASLPRVFHNRVDNDNHAIGIALRGSTSHPLGVGALVEIVPDGEAPTSTWRVGGMGSIASWSEPIVYAGLGDQDHAARVRITWPSGVVQEVEGLVAAMTHEIHEPVFIALSEEDRHLPADGSSTVTVTVFPRTVDGSIDTGQDVAIEITHGTGSFIDEVHADGDGWTRTLRAPSDVGSARIEVRVGGQVSPIHPRIWWTSS